MLAPGPWPIIVVFTALLVCVVSGTLAGGMPLVITPISILDQGPATWAYETALVLMALLGGLCLFRWRALLGDHALLGACLLASTALFLCLIALPFPASPCHDPVALTAMTAMAAHAIIAARRFRLQLATPAAIVAALALLLVLTARLPLVGVGEHFLLVAALPGILGCYGGARAPALRVAAPPRAPASLPGQALAELLERDAVLSGCLWMGLVVSAARIVPVIEPRPVAVLALAAPCWAGGVLAARCAAAFPDAFGMRLLGAAGGFALAGLAGGTHSLLGLGLLLAVGVPFTAGVHWLREKLPGST
jgi:hypothetical membrane protein